MLVSLVALLLGGARATFVRGQICNGVSSSDNAATMLTGKHLKIWEYEWPRFATKDTSAPHGWRGYDIDLIAAVGQKLNFTYEIHELSQQSGETWGNMLQRSVEQGDLVLSYWARTPERIATFSMLAGHIDYSPVLTTMTQPVTEVSFSDRVESTFRPFSYDAWLVLTLIIIASGFIDYLLERETGGSISSSIYEYVGGTLWGGWQDPRSTLSAYYQVMLSFIILIIISSYTCAVAATDATAAAVRAFCAARPCVDRTLRDETRAVLACRSANLAAFLTVRAAPSLSVKSISDLMDRGAPVCIRTNDPSADLYASILPIQLQYYTLPIGDIVSSLLSSQCLAAIVPRINCTRPTMRHAPAKPAPTRPTHRPRYMKRTHRTHDRTHTTACNAERRARYRLRQTIFGAPRPRTIAPFKPAVRAPSANRVQVG
jgi:hypothetical protein